MLLRRPWRRLFRRLEDHGIGPDHQLSFLRKARGIIHIGANVGQEAWIYSLMGKRVIWFEPIPKVYQKLCENLSKYPKQRAFQELIADKDGSAFIFKIANNDGESSSIFDLALHREMYPEVDFVGSIDLRSKSLDGAMEFYGISTSFDALVMDTQGSELLILKGAAGTLRRLRWIYLECADFSAYEGGCNCSEIAKLLKTEGFCEVTRYLKKSQEGIGSYYDILFERSPI